MDEQEIERIARGLTKAQAAAIRDIRYAPAQTRRALRARGLIAGAWGPPTLLGLAVADARARMDAAPTEGEGS
jgi:hypothetical protein